MPRDLSHVLAALDASLRGEPPEGEALTDLLLSSRDALTSLQAELDEARTEADRVAKAASHDLRAPARHLVLFLDLALQQLSEETPGEALEFLGHARSAADKLAQLLDRLQAWSRVGRTPLANEPIDLARRLDVCLQEMRRVHLTTEIILVAQDLPTLYGTRTLFDRVLDELVGNAVTYRTGDRVTVTVTCERQEDTWHLCIADDGLGIPADVQEPFTRLHAWDAIPGAGLGLPIAERIVARHDGSLSLTSEVGVGTVAEVRWPL